MDKAELKAYLVTEEQAVFEGWDFSRMEGRSASQEPDWSYRDILLALLGGEDRLLDMGTGGGEFLLSLNHPYQRTVVTEGYLPNLTLCRERLEPLGIRVEGVDGAEPLPFADASFDLVANRHESFDAAEVWRVLKPGGYFVTQQVGGLNNHLLIQKLIKDSHPAFSLHDLAHNRMLLEAGGVQVEMAREAMLPARYFDLGAVVYYARQIPWAFPGFSVEGCFERLLGLQHELERDGCVTSVEHRFLLTARK